MRVTLSERDHKTEKQPSHHPHSTPSPSPKDYPIIPYCGPCEDVTSPMILQSLYPSSWRTLPFHEGEIDVQKRLGVFESVLTYGPRGIRPFLPEQHINFYQNQPFLVAAARDNRGKMWSTLLFGPSSKDPTTFVTSPHPQTLMIESKPLPGDALESSLQEGSDLGILGIEFATRRRNRVNGRIASNDGQTLEFKVDLSFGPQYIKPRDWWTVTPTNEARSDSNTTSVRDAQNEGGRPSQLSTAQRVHIEEAESVFMATGYRGEGENPTFGNDASYRGGTAGFLKVSADGRRLFLPDYAGNNMYQSIGNLMKDPSMGISVPLYESGGMIQMTGTAHVHWEDDAQVGAAEVSVSDFPGALRWIEFFIDEIVELPAGSFPVRWDSGNREMQLQVFRKVKETDDVTSFYIAPIHGDSPIVSHKPGQHLTFNLPVTKESSISRSYSVSNYGQNQDYYRISVRRDPLGLGSRFLHDSVEVGDMLNVQKPAGDFSYQPSCSECSESVLFLSAGIGVTPILSMLQAFVERAVPDGQKEAIWVHTARDGRHHAFKDEVDELVKTAEGKVRSYVSYTKPGPNDIGNHDLTGRVDKDVLSKIISKLNAQTLKVFMCGPSSFIGTMEDILQDTGVPLTNIQYETF